jgi:hypothetical protein
MDYPDFSHLAARSWVGSADVAPAFGTSCLADSTILLWRLTVSISPRASGAQAGRDEQRPEDRKLLIGTAGPIAVAVIALAAVPRS